MIERFTRTHRLLRGEDFQNVFAGGVRSSDALVTVLAVDNGGRPARLGLAIARKRIRRAVGRNVVKRAARESFRRNLELLHGLDVVVMAKTAAVGKDSASLQASLQHHWHTINERCKRLSSSSSGPTGTA